MQLYANHSVLGKMGELDQILGKGWQFEDNCWTSCGETIALEWKHIDFAKRIIKVAQAETQDTKFDSKGNIVERTTIVSGTKTVCSVREVRMTDIVYNELIA